MIVIVKKSINTNIHSPKRVYSYNAKYYSALNNPQEVDKS